MSGQKIGLVLGSGAARGWAHLGVLQALDELEVKIDVMAGCSVGGLIAGAKLLGVLGEFEEWGRALSPLGALKEFDLKFASGGIIDPKSAFDAFRSVDKLIEQLDMPLGMNATDIATGEEVWITSGSVLNAARATSAIPVVFHAARQEEEYGERWLVDGALANPVPVDLARSLGADKVIAVDLNATTSGLRRFDRPHTREVVPVQRQTAPSTAMIPQQLSDFLHQTRLFVEQQVANARAKADSQPRMLEMAIATADIFQSHLAQAKLQQSKPDVLLRPDLRGYSYAAFDKEDEGIQKGYAAVMDAREEILKVLS